MSATEPMAPGTLWSPSAGGEEYKVTSAQLAALQPCHIPLGDMTSGSPVCDRVRIAARMTVDAVDLQEAAIQQAVSILILDDRLNRLAGKRPNKRQARHRSIRTCPPRRRAAP